MLMKHRFDIHPAMPSASNKSAERRQIEKDTDAFELAGGKVVVFPHGHTGQVEGKLSARDNRERQALTVVSTGFMGADFVTTKEASARGGRC